MIDLKIEQLINKEHKLPSNYIPSDLVILDNNENNFHNYIDKYSKPQISKKVIEALNKLCLASNIDGFDIVVDSGYRSYEYQKIVWDKFMNENIEKCRADYPEKNESEIINVAYNITAQRVATPGSSEHQSGYAFDFGCYRNGVFTDEVSDSMEAKWMAINAYKYGFILRYPEGKENITGFTYEPWHYRYVGYPLSEKLYNNGEWITLEEYYLNMNFFR